jgi:hypothetical protein
LDPSLENSGLASVAVNAYPGGTRTIAFDGWNGEGPGHGFYSCCYQDCTGPVIAIGYISPVFSCDARGTGDYIGFTVKGGALAEAWGGEDGAGEGNGAKEIGELHVSDWKDI